MKAKLLRDERITHPDIKDAEDFKNLATKFHKGEISAEEWNRRHWVDAKAGTVIDHPMAFWLVVLGRAEPVDQECLDAAKTRMAARLPSFDANLVAAAEGADRIDRAQVTGDARYDNTDEQVELFRQKRAAKKAAEGQSIVVP